MKNKNTRTILNTFYIFLLIAAAPLSTVKAQTQSTQLTQTHSEGKEQVQSTNTNDFTYYFEKYLGYEPKSAEPKLFPIDLDLPGLHVHSAPTFTLDGKKFYFSAYYKNTNGSRNQEIFVVKFENGKWQKPRIAPFSGKYSDGGPFISPDGETMIFNSNRPLKEGQRPNGIYIEDLWYMIKSGDGWGEPVHIGFNRNKTESFSSISASGNLFFSGEHPGNEGPFDILVSEQKGGSYSTPTRLTNRINAGFIKTTPLIAPDESFLLFAYQNTPGKNGLNISIKDQIGKWGKPIRLSNNINSRKTQRFPGLSPDGKYFFYYSNKKIYWVNADFIYKMIQEHK